MIIRRRHTANYTTIGNVLFEDDRLAADEVGILAFLLSRPHDWEVRRPALMRRWGIGITAMKRIVNNWMRTGWCHAEKVRLPNGQFFVVYEIRDQPGKELSDDEIREALSLVSSEASDDLQSPEQGSEEGDHHPHVTDQPPPCHPPLAGQPVATDDWPIKSNTNNGLPRDESNQKAEREHARLKEKHAVNLVEFKRRWPTNAGDDQHRVDGAWFKLSCDEGAEAIAGIAAFLENQKRLGRKLTPAGFTYLEQKRWTLLEQAKPDGSAPSAAHARDSVEAKALKVLFDIAGKLGPFLQIHARGDAISYPKPVTPRLLALAQTGPKDGWVVLTRQQAAAWEGLLRDNVTIVVRNHLKEGDRAPWPWPPGKEGQIYTATGPPEVGISDEDAANFT